MEFTKEIQEELRENLNEILTGEMNDEYLRKSARLCTRMYLMTKDIEYKLIKCDEENNSPEIVDSNILIVDIYTREYLKYTIPIG